MKIEGAMVDNANYVPQIQRTQNEVKNSSNNIQEKLHNDIREPLNRIQLMEESEEYPYKLSISEKAVIDAIEKANKALDITDRRFEFSVHEGTKEIVVKVIDKDNDEVIREIPPEKILDMVAKMWEMAGILVDERR